jgi:glutamyl/glutaminyl-tRNA synthetase
VAPARAHRSGAYPASVTGVRVRFAPSPTGALHLGSALTAVANFLFARRAGGDFVLRVDDTDPERSNRRYERTIRQDAEWLGLRFDEGPDEGGPYGPYRQSERMPLYREHAERLVADGHARHDDGAIVFGAPTADVVLHDAARGDVRVAVGAISDFVILRSDGTATYQLATAVDDHLMAISHVIRGEDHLTNTARQIALSDALGWTPPRYAHTALLVADDGLKLSKRAGAPSLAELRGEGYPPEALLNYLAELSCPGLADGPTLLGALAQRFELRSLSRGQSRFDRGRLDWLSQQHLKRLNPLELARRVGQVLELRGVAWHPAQMTALAEGLKGCQTLVDAADAAEAVLLAPRVPPALDDVARSALALFREVRAGWPEQYLAPADADDVLTELRRRGEDAGLGPRDLLHGVRIGLTGREHGVALRYVIAAIGREDALTGRAA